MAKKSEQQHTHTHKMEKVNKKIVFGILHRFLFVELRICSFSCCMLFTEIQIEIVIGRILYDIILKYVPSPPLHCHILNRKKSQRINYYTCVDAMKENENVIGVISMVD